MPILQAHIEAEKVTLWNENSVPLRALWIKNTSGQMLSTQARSTFLSPDTFAGEGVHWKPSILMSAAFFLMPAMPPSTSNFHRTRRKRPALQPRAHCREGHHATFTKEQRNVKKYAVRNADKDARIVVVEYPVEEGWELTPSAPKPEESSESFHRFRVPVGAGKTAELTVEAVHPEETNYALTNLDDDEVAQLVQQKRISPAMQHAFDQILKQKEKIDGLSSARFLRRA